VPLLVPGIGAAALSFLGFRRMNGQRAKFFSMDWAEADDAAGDEACVLIGEEQAKDGKAWFVCTDASEDPAMDCSPAESFGGAWADNTDEYLCKTPKVREAEA